MLAAHPELYDQALNRALRVQGRISSIAMTSPQRDAYHRHVTSDTWCNSVSHSYSGKGWLGNLRIKFTSTFANTGTTAKITGVDLWQQYTP
jgi:hypothetical protein